MKRVDTVWISFESSGSAHDPIGMEWIARQGLMDDFLYPQEKRKNFTISENHWLTVTIEITEAILKDSPHQGLPGPPGPQGPPGDDTVGSVGEQGDQGDQGPTGKMIVLSCPTKPYGLIE